MADWPWLLLAFVAPWLWPFLRGYVGKIRRHRTVNRADLRQWRAESKAIDGSIILPANPTHWMSRCTRCKQTSEFLPDQTTAKDWVFSHYDEKHRKGVVKDA